MRSHLTTVLALSMTVTAAAQDRETFEIGEWHELESEILDETRRFIICTPEGYEGGDDPCLVLYLLDGPHHVVHTLGAVQFHTSNDEMPATIVVALQNTERGRDMTPPAETDDEMTSMIGDSGGADDFIAFFRDELIPYVDSNYRTTGYDILVGHSLGGLVAIHALVHHPDVFEAYVPISPSLWWDGQRLVEQAEAFFSEREELDRTMYMTLGNEGGEMLGGYRRLEAVLAEHTPPGFRWESHRMPEHSHGSIPYQSTLEAIGFIFEGWRLRDPLELYEVGGVEAVIAHYDDSGAEFGLERTVRPQVFGGMAFELAQDGRPADALDVLEHDVDAYRPMPMAYSFIAAAFEEDGDTDQAIACYTRAIELGQNNDNNREALTRLGVDPSTVVVEITVDEAILATYVGEYSAQGAVLTVSMGDDGLELSVPGQSSPMIPRSDTEFIAFEGIVTVTFEVDDTGAVTGMKGSQGGQEMHFERVESGGGG